MLAVTWFTPIYILALLGMVNYFMKPDPKPNKPARWSALESVSVTIFIYFAGQILGGLLAYGLALLTGRTNTLTLDWLQKDIYGQFFSILFIEAISVGLLYLFVKHRRSGLKSIGLWGRPKWIDAGYVLIGYLVYFLLYLVVINVATKLTPINVDQAQQIGFDKAHGLQLVPVFISLVILPPIAEELLMRGFLYTGLKQKLPKIVAAVITSGLFAVAHLQVGSGAALLWVAAIDTFILSLVLIQLRDHTGKLWAPIGLHTLKNLIAFLTLFIFVAK